MYSDDERRKRRRRRGTGFDVKVRLAPTTTTANRPTTFDFVMGSAPVPVMTVTNDVLFLSKNASLANKDDDDDEQLLFILE
jgi:hypothetical protein